MSIKLGDYVRDVVTGFEGTAVSDHNYLHGCRRITLQPKVDKDGKVPDSVTFDEPSLEVVPGSTSLNGTSDTSTGGPDKYTDEGR